jgi:hypothetical protein
MKKITKKEEKEFVKEKLATDQRWALKALIEIFNFQTLAEQKSKNTIDYNGVGFTGTDGRILSSLAQQFKKKRRLSEKQMDILYQKMPKYWGQIIKISNKEQLHLLIQS